MKLRSWLQLNENFTFFWWLNFLFTFFCIKFSLNLVVIYPRIRSQIDMIRSIGAWLLFSSSFSSSFLEMLKKFQEKFRYLKKGRNCNDDEKKDTKGLDEVAPNSWFMKSHTCNIVPIPFIQCFVSNSLASMKLHQNESFKNFSNILLFPIFI